jgi:hypothetical protein
MRQKTMIAHPLTQASALLAGSTGTTWVTWVTWATWATWATQGATQGVAQGVTEEGMEGGMHMGTQGLSHSEVMTGMGSRGLGATAVGVGVGVPGGCLGVQVTPPLHHGLHCLTWQMQPGMSSVAGRM